MCVWKGVGMGPDLKPGKGGVAAESGGLALGEASADDGATVDHRTLLPDREAACDGADDAEDLAGERLQADGAGHLESVQDALDLHGAARRRGQALCAPGVGRERMGAACEPQGCRSRRPPGKYLRRERRGRAVKARPGAGVGDRART